MKTPIRFFEIIFALLYLGLLPNAEAVNPPPDGGYPGFNTAEGQKALFSLTTGTANTAVGWFSLESVTTGSFNTGVGAGTLVLNTGDQNTATGVAALLLNTTGSFNTANGALALLNNTGGVSNTANGLQALFSNVTGANNTGTGSLALFSNTTGVNNTALGASALGNNTSGAGNIALGFGAGLSLSTGDHNIDIGNTGVAGESATIRIGSEFQTRTFIAAIRGVTTGIADAINVVIDSNGQLGTISSSRRFKKEINPMDSASEAILGLKPVTFQYKSDSRGTPQFGLIAEEVAKVNPDLVVRDRKGQIYSVRYDAVNAMLLNEFLKEHKRVEELNSKLAEQSTVITRQRQEFQTTVARQDNEIRALIATVKEQAAQIQKVSAQIEVSKTPLQLTVADSP